jgi:DNA-binding LacI/PurR family transcriptional regulator
MKVTRKTVAQAAGVSEPVVSWVMNGTARENRIPEATIKRIESAARKLGYKPSIYGKLLKTQQSRLLAFLSSDLTDPNTGELIKAVNRAARAKGFGLMLFDLAGEPPEKFDGSFAEGFLLHSPFEESLPRGFKKPWLVLGKDLKEVPSVEVDNALGGELAMRHLSGRAKRVGVIADCKTFPFTRERLKSCPRAERVYYRRPDESQFEAGASAIESWKQDLPDGIFAMGDVIALGALSALHGRGVSVPQRVKIVGFDGTQLSRFASPPLTTVAQPFEKMGETCVDMLLALLNGEKVAPRNVLLPPTLVERESSRA